MSASKQTVKQIYAVMEKHLTLRQIEMVLKELQPIEGNKSVKETFALLLLYHDAVAAVRAST